MRIRDLSFIVGLNDVIESLMLVAALSFVF